eukprot:TRINITY_DN32982_c0_g1_i1.p1 TRINITY_DN32982_c0_g1~~TRINITY_DN32982_c0_g1_i1.p1  ORF type:complete len:323 (+),score=26.04 TRINITY_DN32982_c0_g1_i1:129-1097(+)
MSSSSLFSPTRAALTTRSTPFSTKLARRNAQSHFSASMVSRQHNHHGLLWNASGEGFKRSQRHNVTSRYYTADEWKPMSKKLVYRRVRSPVDEAGVDPSEIDPSRFFVPPMDGVRPAPTMNLELSPQDPLDTATRPFYRWPRALREQQTNLGAMAASGWWVDPVNDLPPPRRRRQTSDGTEAESGPPTLPSCGYNEDLALSSALPHPVPPRMAFREGVWPFALYRQLHSIERQYRVPTAMYNARQTMVPLPKQEAIKYTYGSVPRLRHAVRSPRADAMGNLRPGSEVFSSDPRSGPNNTGWTGKGQHPARRDKLFEAGLRVV